MPVNDLKQLESAIFTQKAEGKDLYGFPQVMAGGQKVYWRADASLGLQGYLWAKYRDEKEGKKTEARLKNLKEKNLENYVSFPVCFSETGQLVKEASVLVYHLGTTANDATFASTLSKNVIDCFEQLIHAVAKLHEKNIVHRDLKPGNVLIFDKGSELDLRIADLDTASDAGENIFVYTQGFVAPEIARDDGTADPAKVTALTDEGRKKVDAYCLGKTLEALFNNSSDKKADLKEICDGLIHPDQTERFTVAEALEKINTIKYPQQVKESKKNDVKEEKVERTWTTLPQRIVSGVKYRINSIKNKFTFSNSEKPAPVIQTVQLKPETSHEQKPEALPLLVDLLAKTTDFYQLKSNDAKVVNKVVRELYSLQCEVLQEYYKKANKDVYEPIIKAIKQVQRHIPADLKEFKMSASHLPADELKKIVNNAIVEYKAVNGIDEKNIYGRRVYVFFQASASKTSGGIHNANALFNDLNDGPNNLDLILSHIYRGSGRTDPTSFRTILREHLEAYTGKKCETLSQELKPSSPSYNNR